MYYLDSSAIVKRYVQETGTNWVNQLYNETTRLFTVRISGVEVTSAFFLRNRNRTLSQTDALTAVEQFRRDWDVRYQVLEVTASLVESAMSLVERYPLRGYDAVQLATALELHRRRVQLALSVPVFVSADARLLEIAALLNLSTENPNDHPATDDVETPPAR